jgi:hypothetical protein
MGDSILLRRDQRQLPQTDTYSARSQAQHVALQTRAAKSHLQQCTLSWWTQASTLQNLLLDKLNVPDARSVERYHELV